MTAPMGTRGPGAGGPGADYPGASGPAGGDASGREGAAGGASRPRGGSSASRGNVPARDSAPAGAPLRRWPVALWAAFAQAVAFAAGSVTAFVAADAAAWFAAPAGVRLWPLGAFAVGFVVAANATPRTGPLGRARWTGSIAAGTVALSATAVALAPGFWFAVAAAGVLGTASGLVAALSVRVLAAVEVGDGSASTVLSAASVLAGVAAGVGALFAQPLYGWRGVFGLLTVMGVLAAWKFCEHVPSRTER